MICWSNFHMLNSLQILCFRNAKLDNLLWKLRSQTLTMRRVKARHPHQILQWVAHHHPHLGHRRSRGQQIPASGGAAAPHQRQRSMTLSPLVPSRAHHHCQPLCCWSKVWRDPDRVQGCRRRALLCFGMWIHQPWLCRLQDFKQQLIQHSSGSGPLLSTPSKMNGCWCPINSALSGLGATAISFRQTFQADGHWNTWPWGLKHTSYQHLMPNIGSASARTRTARILPTRMEQRVESLRNYAVPQSAKQTNNFYRNRNCFDSNLISLHVGTGCKGQSQTVRCARPFPLVVKQADSATNLHHGMYLYMKCRSKHFTSPNYFFIYAGYLSYTSCLQTGHEPWSTSHLSTQGWWKVWEQLGKLLAVSPATMSCKMKDAIRSVLVKRKEKCTKQVPATHCI
jgi:hypothetical protein